MDETTPPTSPSAAAGTDGRTERRILAVILIGSAIVRLILLPSFPDIEADEGLWTNSAKNFVLFGDWFMDGRTHVFLSPVFHALEVAVFTVVGPSIAGARLLSAVAGVLSTWLVYLLVHRISGRRRLALVAAVLFGFSEWTVLLARRALIESTQLCLALWAAVILARPGGARRTVGAAALMSLALLAKLNAAILVVVLAVLPLIRPGAPFLRLDGPALRKAFLFGTGSICMPVRTSFWPIAFIFWDCRSCVSRALCSVVSRAMPVAPITCPSGSRDGSMRTSNSRLPSRTDCRTDSPPSARRLTASMSG